MINKYQISLNVDFKNLSYEGYEKITGDFSKGQSLDFENLEIKNVTGINKNEYDIKDGKIVIKENKCHDIEIIFSGKISEKSLMGIHKSIYDGGYIITTQMEPTGARSVFPCVDRPSEKAVFKLDVDVNDNVEVISNTSVEKFERSPNHSHFIFKETPKMSTYLIYIGIGNFERIKEEYKGRILSVVTTKGKSRQGEFALKLLERIIDSYEEYYKIKYPLEKMDLIAIPQFAAGAMENWGAITFREIAILYNESMSFSFKKQIGKTLSHEMAHQWFGNLVTMEWWDDLWLNESFATFVGNKILEKLEKGWNLWEEFVIEDTLPSMNKDSLLTTHPVRVPVNDPSEIAEIFDQISYGKGASILRMIEHFIGEERFRSGVIDYLKIHSYGNAKGEDLWNSLSKYSGLDMGKIMGTWLGKEGYPYLEISVENGRLKIVQKRFTYLDNNDSFLWAIPLFYLKGEKEESILMEEREIVLPVESNIIIDPKGVGYYRVLYPEKIVEQFPKLGVTSEFVTKLIDDSYAFLLSSKIKLNDFLKLLSYFQARNDYLLVNLIINKLETLNTILTSTQLTEFSKKYMRDKLEYFKNLKDENSSVIIEKIYTILPIIDESFRRSIYRNYDDYSKVPPEQRMGILISAIIEGYKVDSIINKIFNAENDMEQVRRIVSLAMTRNSDIFFNFMNTAKDRIELRGNILYGIIYATRNSTLRTKLWEWILENFDSINEVYKGSGSVSFLVEDLIAFAGINNKSYVDLFLSNKSIPEAERAIKKGKEYLQIYERLIKETQS